MRSGGRQGLFVGGHPGMQISEGELHPPGSAGATVLLGCVSLFSLGPYNQHLRCGDESIQIYIRIGKLTVFILPHLCKPVVDISRLRLGQLC